MNQTSALLVTLALEVPLALGLVAARRWAPGQLGLVAAASLGASLLTHPLLWMVDGPLRETIPDWGQRVAALEALIVLVEAAVYRLGAGLGPLRALAVSFVANGASVGAGLLIYALSAPR